MSSHKCGKCSAKPFATQSALRAHQWKKHRESFEKFLENRSAKKTSKKTATMEDHRLTQLADKLQGEIDDLQAGIEERQEQIRVKTAVLEMLRGLIA